MPFFNRSKAVSSSSETSRQGVTESARNGAMRGATFGMILALGLRSYPPAAATVVTASVLIGYADALLKAQYEADHSKPPTSSP